MEKNEYPGEYLKSIAKEIISIDGNKWLDAKDEERLIFFKNFAVKSLINDCFFYLDIFNRIIRLRVAFAARILLTPDRSNCGANSTTSAPTIL